MQVQVQRLMGKSIHAMGACGYSAPPKPIQIEVARGTWKDVGEAFAQQWDLIG